MFWDFQKLDIIRLNLDMVQSLTLTTIVFLLGVVIKNKVELLKKYCIPSPVIGGFLFATLVFILKQIGVLFIVLDTSLQDVLMTAFFTTVGFTASFKVLKKGGIEVIKFLFVAILLVISQNLVGVFVAKSIGANPLLGLISGSISMIGGHGASGAFGPIIQSHGLKGSISIAMACATFGLVAGSILGGPIANLLVKKYNLKNKDNKYCDLIELESPVSSLKDCKFEVNLPKIDEVKLANASMQIIIAMGCGSLISLIFSSLKIIIPSYIGGMIFAAIMRNISDIKSLWETPEKEISSIGGICLSLFLSMAMCNLKLWELIDLAIPIIILLMAQTILMILFAYFITFRVMGKDYKAAVLASGHCGFGMGATPNGIANMESVTNKYGPCHSAFFILPLVGALFIEFFNSGIITTFLNLM